MTLYFIQEAVYYRYKNDFYSPRMKYDSYWERYLNHFEKVNVIARVQDINELPKNYNLVSGPKVSFLSLPFYNGALGFYKKRSIIKEIILQNINKNAAYVIRIPGPIGNLAAKILNKNKIKFAVEVVGDPYEVAKFLKLPPIVKFFLKSYSLKSMQAVVSKAEAALYVTEKTLQKRYPATNAKITASASNVIIKESDIIECHNRLRNTDEIIARFKDIHQKSIRIGVLGMLYPIKSPLEIVEAVNGVLKQGFNVELYFAGDGYLKSATEQKAKELNIQKRVKCLGSLASGKEVFDFLDSLDLYIQFSKTEGIPRSLLEAMARACPVISSNVGGIPEFVSEEFLVQSGDTLELSNKIIDVLSNAETYQLNIKNSHKSVQNFTEEKLKKKRFEYYQKVKNILQTTQSNE
ncbi:glycosyltransferase [Brumimicrobium aurantiacum]|uniref:Glycosyltransferase n=1 Tax=Brumimicrobium aurantiacum TaxID=1737063 RepID=A0A3E1EYZ9_9FLAO|nr:glycosyltransferase [Brumimicrobium aurantiacum]RFC54784.1 glycosyltransferase [Brumimicrobium aurantiacum]